MCDNGVHVERLRRPRVPFRQAKEASRLQVQEFSTSLSNRQSESKCQNCAKLASETVQN